jgi:hypothetical protein
LHATAVALGAALYQNTVAQMLLFTGFVLSYRLIYIRLERSSRQRSLIQYDQQTGEVLGTRYWPAPAARTPQAAVAAAPETGPRSSPPQAAQASAQPEPASTPAAPSAKRSGPGTNKSTRR